MDFNIPEPFDVTHWTRPKLGKNPAGQVRYGEPVPRARKVRGFVPAGDSEGIIQASTGVQYAARTAGRTLTELVMLDDEGDWPADSAVELWDGRKFEVNGPVRDYNLGPFGFKPGYAIDLRRVTDGEA